MDQMMLMMFNMSVDCFGFTASRTYCLGSLLSSTPVSESAGSFFSFDKTMYKTYKVPNGRQTRLAKDINLNVALCLYM